MEDPTVHVTAWLLEAGETDVADRAVDGDDHDEASWYANWLINRSELQ